MDDTVPRRHSYPRIDTLQDFDLTNPSAIDLHEIHPDGIEGLNPETTSYRLDRGAGSNDGEVARPSLSDFNKDLDNIQSRMSEPRTMWQKSLTVDQEPMRQIVKPGRLPMRV